MANQQISKTRILLGVIIGLAAQHCLLATFGGLA